MTPEKGVWIMNGKLLVFILLLSFAFSTPAVAREIGQIKKAKGTVEVERTGKRLPAAAGMKVQAADTIRTGKDGAVGVTLTDDTMLSAGPGSVLTLSRYAFDATTHQGILEANMGRGTLSMVSGKLAKQSPNAVWVSTPDTIIGVRGTEFFVSVEGDDHE